MIFVRLLHLDAGRNGSQPPCIYMNFVRLLHLLLLVGVSNDHVSNRIELEMLSNLVADYSDDHFDMNREI